MGSRPESSIERISARPRYDWCCLSCEVSLPTQNIIHIAEGTPAKVPHFDSVNEGDFRANRLLAGINAKAYAQIANGIHIIPYQPNEIIFEENDPGDSLYLIARGAVKISKKGRAGQQETLAYLMAQDFFGACTQIAVAAEDRSDLGGILFCKLGDRAKENREANREYALFAARENAAAEVEGC